MEQHSAIKKSTATCLDLENVTLSKISQTGKASYYTVSH